MTKRYASECMALSYDSHDIDGAMIDIRLRTFSLSPSNVHYFRYNMILYNDYAIYVYVYNMWHFDIKVVI